MHYVHARIVCTARSRDRTRELDLLARHDGLFEFRESKLIDDDHPVYGLQKIWKQGYASGLFQTRREAEREATAIVDWLRMA